MLTDAQRARMIALFAKGLHVKTACDLARVGRSSYYDLREKDPAFAAACDEALAGVEEASVDAAIADDPQWFLERRFPKRWGKKVAEVQVNVGNPDSIQLPADPNDCATVLEHLAKRQRAKAGG